MEVAGQIPTYPSPEPNIISIFDSNPSPRESWVQYLKNYLQNWGRG